MKKRKIIGALMILTVLGGCFGVVALGCGLVVAIKLWGVALFLAGLFFGGATLLFR